ncbi:MAG: glycoside hydrolase family 16 protein [Clostridia bacterium]|nr:glycoside hydrolase family 16 protein [Clostridia bacterium]
MAAFNRIIAFFMSIIGSIALMFDIPYYATGKQVDLSGYELVWEDEFRGERMDGTKWKYSGSYGANRGYYSSPDIVEMTGEEAVFHIKYYEEGLNGNPAAYYTASFKTDGLYEPTYGYFECRAKLPKVSNGSGAFWLNSHNAYNNDDDPSDGAEVDIMESQNWNAQGYYGQKFGKSAENVIEHNIHYGTPGTQWYHRLHAKGFKVRGDPYEEFHTYGLLWDENGYTFYIDGVATMSTTLGLSHAPEYICLSCDIRGEDGVPYDNSWADGQDATFVVDYVRVYQKG